MTPSAAVAAPHLASALAALHAFVTAHPRLFVLTGAGCSTASGIPDYRDADGQWKGAEPIQHARFMGAQRARQRYWARSLAGWPHVARARPSAAHDALAALEGLGRVGQLVTQNVDGLHQRAGSRRVIDLHGRLDRVDCQSCAWQEPRGHFQQRLLDLNPGLEPHAAGALRPDGDVPVPPDLAAALGVPACPDCGGIVKPNVVFFGGSVPRPRVERAMARLEAADAVLAVGTSLMVYSGYRFVRRARELGLPVAALNLGRTRADDDLALKVRAPCHTLLPALVETLDPLAPRRGNAMCRGTRRP